MRNFALFLIAIILVCYCNSSTALSDSPRTGGWLPNGQVNAVLSTQDTVYVGGQFTCLSPYTGGGVPVDASTALPAASFPEVEGTVYAVCPDGGGGWYIGGQFSVVGGLARSNICRILSSGSVDPAWIANANSTVHTLALSGGTVYAGGEFTTVGASSRNYLAALDAATGAVYAWNPNPDGYVRAVCVSGSTAYVGGEFSNLGVHARACIAEIDLSTAQPTAWNPGADSAVYALALDGTTLFAGGSFTNIGGAARNYIAAVNTSTGNAEAWNPGANSWVRAIGIDGGTLFAGGLFTTVGGQSRNRIAAINAATGAVEAWNPGADSAVFSLVIGGSTIYVGGAFSACGGQARNCAAAVDTASGNVLTWNPVAGATVYALAAAGSEVYIGGSFTGIGGVIRNHIAALDASTGIPTAWNPDVNNTVSCLALAAGNIFAGGTFSSVGGAPRNHLAAIDQSTGVPTAWAADTDDEVLALCAHDGVLYVGGSFSQIAGESRSCIGAIDPATGSVAGWNPSALGSVFCLAASGSRIFAGGNFFLMGGQLRMNIAAITTGGAVTAFAPNTDDCVNTLAAAAGTLYVGGNFTSIGGEDRNRLAAISLATDTVTSWDPNVDNAVYALALSGSDLYVGGEFFAVGGSPKPNLAVVDTATAAPGAWNPNPNAAVRAIGISSVNVDVAGAFTTIGGENRANFAQFLSGLPAPTNPGATAAAQTSITWTWTDNADSETGFNVYDDPGAGPPTTLQCTTAANAQSWQHPGLLPNGQYAFQAAATNGVIESQKTANFTAWTLIEPVAALSFSNVSTTSITVGATNAFTNLAAGSSGLFFENLTQATSSGWQQHDGPWVSSGLQINTEYTFSGKSRNGEGNETTAATDSKWTQAAVPAAPVVDSPTIDSAEITVGAGDGNPSTTEYAISVTPAVNGNAWVQSGGALGSNSAWQTAAAWSTTEVTGLNDDTAYLFSVKARNGEGIETTPGPAAGVATLPDLIPSVAFTLESNTETAADSIEFTVMLDEPTVPEFGAAAVVVNGLAGTVAVTGDYPAYNVRVDLTDPEADGDVSITVPPDLLYDTDSNPCPGGTSQTCHVYNWHGFVQQPASVDAYTGDLVTLEVTPACGATSLEYSWKWQGIAKVVSGVGNGSPVLLLDNVDESREGQYWCEITYDGSTHPSAPATVSVNEPLSLAPVEAQTILSGETCTFSVWATGGYPPLAYTWAKNGQTIFGATQSTYTTPPLGVEDSGSTYTVTVNDSNTDQASTSAQVTVETNVPAAGTASLFLLTTALLLLAAKKLVFSRMGSCPRRSFRRSL